MAFDRPAAKPASNDASTIEDAAWFRRDASEAVDGVPASASQADGARASAQVERVYAAVDAALHDAIAAGRIVGGVVAVSVDGAPAHLHAAGLADRETQRPMRTDTLFRLASMSKPIVTTAAMALVAQGRLSLDAPVTQWLPDFRPALADGSTPTITVRQLLAHTSGLGYRFIEPDAQGPLARAGVSDGMDLSTLTLDENVQRIATAPLHFAPGSQWLYALGIDVIGAVVARAHGTSLPQAVRDLVTAPLGMTDTDFHAVDAARLDTPYVIDTPTPHRMAAVERVPMFPETVGIDFAPARALDASQWASAGAGMVASAADFLRLLEALRTRDAKLLPGDVVDEMARVQTGELELAGRPGWGFGLGFAVLRDTAAAQTPEAIGTWRWGGAWGHAWFVDPARRVSVALFTNTVVEGSDGQTPLDVRDAVYNAFG